MRKFTQSRPLLTILFTVFIDLLGFGILIPVIPHLLANPHSPFFMLPAGLTVKQGYILLGFLTAAFPLFQFLAAPILGQLSDRYGRRRLLAISIFGTCLSYVIFALGIHWRSIWLLFAGRILDGITGGNIAIAQAAIADITRPEDRAKNFGLMGAAFGIGFVLGPYIGGKLSDPSVISWFDATTPFWFAAILSLLNALSIKFFFPETRTSLVSKIKIEWTRSFHNILNAYKFRGFRTLFATSFLISAGFAFFVSFFSVYLINKFGFTQGNIGDFFAYIGIWIAITQAVITRALAKKFKEYQILRISIMGISLGVISFFAPTVSWGIYLVAPILAISNGLTMANLTGLISRTAAADVQGEILGIQSSIQAFAQSVPPMLSGYIAANISPDAPIFVSSMTILFAGFVFLLFYKPSPIVYVES